MPRYGAHFTHSMIHVCPTETMNVAFIVEHHSHLVGAGAQSSERR
jgi:hypothetical protein